MSKKKPSKQVGNKAKNESNRGDSKGETGMKRGKERIKSLEREVELLKRKLERAELINESHQRYLEEETKYLLEVSRLCSLVGAFAKWSHKSKDKAYNEKLAKKLKGDNLESLKFCTSILEDASQRYRKHFDKGLKIHQQKNTIAKGEFNNWIEGKRERILEYKKNCRGKYKKNGRGWKAEVFKWMKEDGISFEKTTAYKYLENF